MSDTIPAPGRPAPSALPAVAVIEIVAAARPARVAAEYGDDFVTYGRLHATIQAYRTVMDAKGMDANAAVFAAVLSTLPSLADQTPGRVADRVADILREITGDTGWDQTEPSRQVG